MQLKNKPDFIIRLDDDDIISPDILERVSKENFDCYADEFHTFYDLSSGKICQQKRNWLPNTVIHSFKHAMKIMENGKPLFSQDHSEVWLNYYSGKKIIYSPKEHPVYLRIISPTSVSGKKDFNSEGYQKYLYSFGKWGNFGLNDFKIYRDDLNKPKEIINKKENFNKKHS